MHSCYNTINILILIMVIIIAKCPHNVQLNAAGLLLSSAD